MIPIPEEQHLSPGLLRSGGPAAAGVEAPCFLFRCGQELGNVSLSPWETHNDLAAHLVFCTSQRYVSKMNQRLNGVDHHIDGINGRIHATGISDIGARKNLVPVLRRDHF